MMASTALQVGNRPPVLMEDGRQKPVPMRGRYYRPELDVLRFLAFLIVFVHHAMYNFSPTVARVGAYGLSLFFVLSAFLITELLQREKRLTGTIKIRSFYIRRGLRIWPLYFSFLAGTVVLAWVVPTYKAPLGMLVCFTFLLGNTYIGQNGFPNNPASYLWSISVEEQFYLFWPFLNRKCSPRTLAWIAFATLPVGSLTALTLWWLGASAAIGIWTNSLVEFQFFGYGVLLSLLLKGRIPRFAAPARVLLFVAGGCVWFAAARWSGINMQGREGPFGPMLGYHIVGMGCLAILLSLYGLDERWLPRPFVYLGKVSYGLYVFHELSLEIAERLVLRAPAWTKNGNHVFYGVEHATLGLTISIALAWASYRYFESPFLRLKEKFTVVRSRVV